jgi:ATP-dependent RNA helicase RhlE
VTFKDLLSNETLSTNLNSLGYTNPTAIQEKAIPLILEGKDLLGIAQTGTGKSAAFCLPILNRLMISESKGINTLILVPTRELATQIQNSFETYGRNLPIKSVAIFGGVNQKIQVSAIREGVSIIVATPGRLLDLIDQGIIRLNKVETLVLDEADQMLDMGFIEDIEKIIELLPVKRQTLFFSATMPEMVVRLSNKILYRPVRVEVTPQSSTVSKISQKVYLCKREDKFQLLRKILKTEERELVIVFTKTKNSADKVKEYLFHHRIASTVIHGDKGQEERERALANFKNASMKVLIATDIAARGIDVQGISHVINFELPLEAENYVHRIGRTARAGKEGTAISFCEDSEISNLERIEKLIGFQIPYEKFKGSPEASGKWLNTNAPSQLKKAPTPGISQEKRGFIDHSKRQTVAPGEKSKAKSHPGFKNKKKRK